MLRTILAGDPHHRDALELMGRACEDAGEADEASRWRRLAREVLPVETRGAAQASFVRTGARRILVGTACVGGLALTGLVALVSVWRKPPASPVPGTLDSRVEAIAPVRDATPVLSPSSAPVADGGARAGGRPAAAPPAATATEEEALARLRGQGTSGARVLSLQHDPRAALLTITFLLQEGDAPRQVAAAVARRAFATFRSPRTLALRGVRGRDLVYLAGATRERYAAVDTDEWRATHAGDLDALAGALLADEWPESGASPETDAGP